MAMCTNCGDKFDDRRRNLGYPTCLPCGDKAARGVTFCVVNIHKSNYTVVSNVDELKGLNKYAGL
jgi:ribosomal protein L37AE/L43A